MAFKFTSKEVLTPKISVTIEFELQNSSLTLEEATTRIQRAIDVSSVASDLVIMLLSVTRSSTWELKKLEVL